MVDSNSNSEKTLDSFVKELNRYSGQLHSLYRGLNKSDIQKLQRELDISLPEMYVEFLMKFNGATLFFCDVEIWGIIRDFLPKSDNPAYDLIKENLVIRRQKILPSSYLVIGNYSYGPLICLDLELIGKKDCRVVLWDPDVVPEITEWNGLLSWLFYELEQGKNAFNYDGSEKQ